MKPILSIAVFLVGITAAHAQTENQDSSSDRKNDLMISPIELIAAPLLNITYERIITEKSGVGINAMLFFGNKDNSDYGFSQFSPYYRMYFGKKQASGFFVEGFVPITTTKDSYYYSYYSDYNNYTYNSQEIRRTTVGVGIGLGGKWVTRNHIVFEVSGGLARRFGGNNGNSDFYDGENLTGKGMLGIGYRF